MSEFSRKHNKMVAQRKYRESHREQLREAGKKYYRENKERILEYGKRYKQDNNEKITKERKEYKRKNHDKIMKQNKQYKENNKERDRDKIAGTRRKNYYRSRYNITVDEYDKIFDDQGGVCLICKRPQGNRRLSIDHNHKTGEVRGLLCNNCNAAIGLVNEDQKILTRIKQYLKQYEG